MRLRRTWSFPTTGMLFSATHPITHALQPVHDVRSIAIPHACPSYFHSGYMLSAFGGASAPSWTDSGFLRYSSSLPEWMMLRRGSGGCLFFVVAEREEAGGFSASHPVSCPSALPLPRPYG